MENITNLLVTGHSLFVGLGILSIIMIILCLYFILTFFQYLKLGDDRLIRQSKLAAVFCFAMFWLIPAFYHLYIYFMAMNHQIQ